MVMAFRSAVRHALAAPLGGALRARFSAPLITALLADGAADSRDELALSEMAEALVQAGLPRGRMFTLLTGGAATGSASRERARELHDTLGMPVIVHDPARSAHFRAGTIEVAHPPFALEIDDELREAEAVVIVGRYGADAAWGVRGGPAALLPGAASAACAAAMREAIPETGLAPHGPLRAHTLACAHAAAALVPVDFALVWSDDDPPRVLAGSGDAVFAAAEAAGWLDRVVHGARP